MVQKAKGEKNCQIARDHLHVFPQWMKLYILTNLIQKINVRSETHDFFKEKIPTVKFLSFRKINNC